MGPAFPDDRLSTRDRRAPRSCPVSAECEGRDHPKTGSGDREEETVSHEFMKRPHDRLHCLLANQSEFLSFLP